MPNGANVHDAARRARELLEAHGVQQPPVDVERIAVEEGVDVVFQPLEDQVSGILVKSEDAPPVIGVNARHHPNRQRFTLAHELAHHLLHDHRPTVYVDDVMVHFRGEGLHPPRQEEVEANTFAAALLMPEEFLQQDLAGRMIDASDEAAVRALARRYRVSAQALAIRLTQLGLVPGLPVRRD